MPIDAPSAQPVPAAPTAGAIVRAINDARRGAGLARVRLSRDLVRVARAHTRDMLRHQLMSHDAADGTPFAARMARRLAPRYQRVGETIFWAARESNPTAATIVRAWMKSPPHRAQLLDRRYGAVGVATATGPYHGIDTLAVTADFGAARAVPMR